MLSLFLVSLEALLLLLPNPLPVLVLVLQVAVLLYSYPEQRSITDPQTGLQRGIVGSQQTLNDSEVSSQPIVDWSWHPQKTGLAVCASLDQTIRLTVVTKLSLY